MEAAGILESLSIFAVAQGCRHELRACTQLPKLVESHWAYDRLSDFDLWDSGVGASAGQYDSLDLRLRDDDTSRKVVITSLSTLQAWTNLCRKLAQANSSVGRSHKDQLREALSSTPEITTEPEDSEDITLEEAQNSVEELQALLVKLGVAIRQAGRASRLSNADRSFEKHKNDRDIIGLVNHLTFILHLSNSAREIVQAENGQREERLDTPLMIYRVNELREPLQPEQEILVRANAQRRYRFHYAKTRSESLGALSMRQTQLDSPSQAIAEIASQDQAQQTSISKIPEEGTTLPKALHPSKNVVRSVRSLGNSNQLSAHRAEVSLAKVQEDVRATAPPTARAVASDYPKAPKTDPGKFSMRCPYCRMTISSQTTQSNMLWRKHVSDDLQPYTCYLQDCPQGNCFFDSFKAWKAHVLSDDHQSSEWMCFYCDVENFDNVNSFGKHLHEMHEDEIVEEDLSDLILACQTQEPPVLDRCPICSLSEGAWEKFKKKDLSFEPKSKIFLDHIGDCLHGFTLRALPLPEQDEQDSTSIGAPKTRSSHRNLSDLPVDACSDVDEGQPGITKAEVAFIETLDSGQSHNVAEWMETCQQSKADKLSTTDPTFETGATPEEDVMTEAPFQSIALELRETGNESWSRIPRIYYVLKHIDELQMTDAMLDRGWNDLWIPLRSRDLPKSMPQTTQQKFIDAQYLVLDTPNTNVEDARHYHFSSSSDVRFQSHDILGHDATGTIDQVTSRDTSEQYTRKWIRRPKASKNASNTMQYFTSELLSLKKLSGHRHMLRYVGSYTDPTNCGIIMAPMVDCSLSEFLDLDLDDNQRSLLRSFFGCLTSTLVFMHESGIRHQDIKPSNVFIKNDQVFLTRFGLNRADSRSLLGSESDEPLSYTPRYAAPEVVQYVSPKRSADIWSLGCVFLEMWTVLCGKTLRTLRDHFTSPYYTSQETIGLWIELVASAPELDSDRAPVIWIKSMLQELRNDRPIAQKLWHEIRILSERLTSEFKFAGRCCLHLEESVHQSIEEDTEEQSKPASKDTTSASEPEKEDLDGTEVRVPPRDTTDWYQQAPLPNIRVTGTPLGTESTSFEPHIPSYDNLAPEELSLPRYGSPPPYAGRNLG